MKYKSEFNQYYDMYRKLHNVLDQVSKRFTSLESQLNHAPKGSEEFRVSSRNIFCPKRFRDLYWGKDDIVTTWLILVSVSECQGTNQAGIWEEQAGHDVPRGQVQLPLSPREVGAHQEACSRLWHRQGRSQVAWSSRSSSFSLCFSYLPTEDFGGWFSDFVRDQPRCFCWPQTVPFTP